MATDTIYPVEGTQTVVAGASIPFSCNFQGATTLASASVKAYKGTSDVTSTLFPAGSCTISGNSVQLPTLVIPDSPARQYVIVLTITIDGVIDPKKIIIECEKATDGL